MSEYANAKIVSYNLYGERVSACAARISTTVGNAFELFDAAEDSEANQKLIGKVLSSGHSSVIEHTVFSLALKNVSVYVEQFFIEHRLASFTVKSRRYVDFGAQGYYIPPELAGEDRDFYRDYMNALFDAYKKLLDRGIPREDARFILPYALCSSFYCTLNARELIYMLAQMKSGRGKSIPELRTIASELEEQLLALFPGFEKHLAACERQCADCASPAPAPIGELEFVPRTEAGKVSLLSAPQAPQALLSAALAVTARDIAAPAELIKSVRPRELELLNYAYSVQGITLSGITHLARHRMQTLLVPELDALSPARVILPESIASDPAMYEVYTAAAKNAYDAIKAHESADVYKLNRRYFALSGTLADVVSSMNARELLLFTELRSCLRAQWEIRDVATDLLFLLRDSFPEVFDAMGPSCFVKGFCPEGRLGCGKMDEIKAKFGGKC